MGPDANDASNRRRKFGRLFRIEEEVNATSVPGSGAGALTEGNQSIQVRHATHMPIQPGDGFPRRRGHSAPCRVSQLSCSPIRMPSIGTSTLTPFERRDSSSPSLYLAPARNSAVSPGRRMVSRCVKTLADQARRSLTPISFRVKSYGLTAVDPRI